MNQKLLFDNTSFPVLPHDGDAIFYPYFFSTEESAVYLAQLLKEIKWKQEPIKIFGKEIMQPPHGVVW